MVTVNEKLLFSPSSNCVPSIPCDKSIAKAVASDKSPKFSNLVHVFESKVILPASEALYNFDKSRSGVRLRYITGFMPSFSRLARPKDSSVPRQSQSLPAVSPFILL
ncbi:unknown [Ruminococcus sp. CAG:624]|nr:unknown [Ruminococcus sp. CAG:624]